MNRIKTAFDRISADDNLKQNTITFLQKERIRRERKFKYVYRYAAACAVVIAVVSGVVGYGFFYKVVSYISIDVNPSIELALNCFDNVVTVSAYNNDGMEVLKELDLKGKPYTEAIDNILANQEFISYIRENDRIDFTVVSDKQDEIIAGIQSCSGYKQHSGYCHNADDELAAQAHGCGLSAGKYRAYEELAQYDKSITAEDCRDMTMRQIYDMIRKYSVGANPQEAHKNGCYHHGH